MTRVNARIRRGGLLSLALGLMLQIGMSPAVSGAEECPSGDPLNCHPNGFVNCDGSTTGQFSPLPGGALSAEPGSVFIFNDATTIAVEINSPTYENSGIRKLFVHAASTLAGIPSDPNAYQLVRSASIPQVRLSVSVPMFSSSCGYVSVIGEIEVRDEFNQVVGLDYVSLVGDPIPGSSFSAAHYCTTCSSCGISAGQFRTQTQGGWGASASGNNPGAYRNSHFAQAFPTGVVLGCNRTLSLSSSLATEVFLPAGGPPNALSKNWVNPGEKSLKNVLAGQVTALALSLGFDASDASFGASTFALANLELASGPLAGKTVQEAYDEAVRFLGGCGSSYTASELNAAISDINENFVDGTEVGDALVCPSN
jgi:hypothetical protein